MDNTTTKDKALGAEGAVGAADHADLKNPSALPDSFKNSGAQIASGAQIESGYTGDSGESEKKAKKSRFFKGLAIYFLIMIGVVLIGSGIWWEYVEAYENSQPERSAEQIVAGFDSYLCELIKQTCKENSLSKYESFDSVYNEMLKPSFYDEFSFKKYSKEFTTQNPVYIVYCGEKAVAKLTLEKGRVEAFGLQRWNIKSTELLADVSELEPMSVTVKIPEGAVLYINGTKAEGEEPVGKEKYEDVSEYEKDSADIPQLLVYKFDGFYRNPDIKAFDKNEDMLVTVKEDGDYVCLIPGGSKHTISITAPSSAIVSVGGVQLKSEQITDSEIKYDKALPYDKAYLVKYEVGGLITYPEVVVALENGERLSAKSEKDGEYVYGYSESMLHDVTVAIPDGCRILVGGNEADEGVLSSVGKDDFYPDMQRLGAYIADMVKPKLYTISGLYGEPELTVFDSDGNEYLPVSGTESDKADIYFLPPVDSALSDEHSALVEKFVDAYIRYTSGGYKVVDQTFDAAAEYLLSDSPAYEKLLSTKFSFGQNKEFFIKSREIKSYDYRKLGANCFSCKVDFTAYIYTTYTSTVQNVTDTVTDMKLWYAYSDGEWKIIGLGF